MGHRYYFYLVEKDTLEEIHNMNKGEFYSWRARENILDEADGPHISLYNIGRSFFELGSEYDNTEGIQKNSKPLFKDKYLSERYEHYEPFIAGKEALLNVINHQVDIIVKYYENMLHETDKEHLLEKFDETSKEKVYEQHLKSMYSEWKNRSNKIWAIDLSEGSPVITTSWKYEYSIFELVRLYKTTDWNKYGLLFMGW